MKNKRLIFIALYIFLIFINGFSKELSIFRPSNVEYVAKGENKICAIMGNTLVDFNLTNGKITESGLIFIPEEMPRVDMNSGLNKPKQIVFVNSGKWLLVYPKELIYWLPEEDKYISLYKIDNTKTISGLVIHNDKIYLLSFKEISILNMEGKVLETKETEEFYHYIDYCEYGIVLWSSHNISVLTESLEKVSQCKLEQQILFCTTDELTPKNWTT
ncbi:MAG TPA: hypothetical protein PKJ42_06700 [Candidatus Goldiibacteriota bacterium]|nr:hypothetical protein [Candidatus Goldiibacteriota bacterium]